jgi:hypothetical protein
MADSRQTALADFKRIMKWIAVIAVVMVAGALTYLKLFSTLDTATVLATIFGVFCSVLLGCGLFAAAFFSDKSGLDQAVTDVTQSERKLARRTALPRTATIERNPR